MDPVPKKQKISIHNEILPEIFAPSFKIIDSPNPNFSGRKKILSTIHSIYTKVSQKSRTNPLERTIILHSLEGMGKTALALKYAQLYIHDPIIQNVAFINLESEDSLKASFSFLADKLQLSSSEKSSDKESDTEQIAKDVYQHFSDHIGNGLFIFRNTIEAIQRNQDRFFGIEKYFPSKHLARMPLILMTVPTEALKKKKITTEYLVPKDNILEVPPLSDEDAVDLFKKQMKLTKSQLNDQREMSAIFKLASLMQGYPLGLVLAASSVEHQEWNDMNEELQGYQEKSKMPQLSKWNGKDIEVKYKDILSHACLASIEKIIASEYFAEGILKFLNILAYMAVDDIQMKLASQLFDFVYKQEVPREVFSILNKSNLINIHRDRYSPDVFNISIHRGVQRYLREKLANEKDESFLNHYCKFLCHSKSQVSPQHLKCLLTFLKENHWDSDNAIYLQYSVILIHRLIGQSTLDEIIAMGCLKQLIHPIESKDPSSMQSFEQLAKNVLGDNISNLLFVCVFHFQNHDNGNNIENESKVFEKNFGLSSENVDVDLIVMGAFKSYFKFLVLPVAKNSKKEEEMAMTHLTEICFTILTSDSYSLEIDFKKQVYELLLQQVDCFGGQLETADELFKLLEGYFVCNEDIPSSARYLDTILKVHTQLYFNVDVHSRDQMKNYWKSGGPICYAEIALRLLDEQNSEWSKMFADTFVHSGCLQILVQHLHFLSAYFNDKIHPNCLLVFIMLLGYSFDCTQKIVESDNLIKYLHDLTAKSLACSLPGSQQEEEPFLQFRCLLAWFGLFSQNQTVKDSSGNEWSILSLEDELKLYLPLISQKAKEEEWRKKNAWWLTWMVTDNQIKHVLTEFIKSAKGNEEAELAEKTAAVIFALLELNPIS